MPKLKKKKAPPQITPGSDGLVLVEVVKERLDRKAGDRYKVDPARAHRLIELGLAALPTKGKTNG